MKRNKKYWRGCVTALALLPPMLASAQADTLQHVQTTSKHSQVSQDGFSAPVSIAALARQRGGSDLVVNDMQLSGYVTGNSAVNVATGTNTIGSSAFSGASGLPMVIQNSGANVLIQNAVILNLQIN
jgi:hypothetical protein